MSACEVVSVVVVDDHAVVRSGIVSLLSRLPAIDVVGEAGSACEGVEVVLARRPAVTLVDFALPDMDGLALVRQVVAGGYAGACLMLTMHTAVDLVSRALEAGAVGYLTKMQRIDEVAGAVLEAAAGARVVSPALTRLLSTSAAVRPVLTAREREVVALVGHGLTSKEIAAMLGISHRTVDVHRGRAMRKLDLSNAAELVRYALEAGLA